MITLAPITVAAGQPAPIPLDATATGMIIANESNYALQIQAGGINQWLPAWTIDVYDLRAMAAIGTPTAAINAISSGQNPPSSVILVTVLHAGDRVIGTYPCALARQVNVGAAVTTNTTNQLVNTTNAHGQNIINAAATDEQHGGTGPQVQFYNDGQFFIIVDDNGTLVTVASSTLGTDSHPAVTNFGNGNNPAGSFLYGQWAGVVGGLARVSIFSGTGPVTGAAHGLGAAPDIILGMPNQAGGSADGMSFDGITSSVCNVHITAGALWKAIALKMTA